MFGYVKVQKDELKIKDYNAYKAVYCSLCRELGRQYGLAARMTLNYDVTFLAVLALSITEQEPCFVNARCSFNPFVRCKKCSGRHPVFDFAAGVAMLLLCYKLMDNIADEKRSKRLGARLLAFFLRGAFRRAQKRFPSVDRVLRDMWQAQRRTEQGAPSLDAAAHPTAQALGSLCAMLSEDETQSEILHRLGYCLGRYVYLIDALDDYEADRASGSFNAFLVSGARAAAPEAIRHSIGEAVHAYYLLTPLRYQGVMENILTKGLNNTLMQVQEKRNQGKADAI